MELISLIVIFFAIFLGFSVGTIIGFGAALIAFPIMLIALPIQEAVAVISLIYLIFSAFQLYQNRKMIDMKTILHMSIGIILGLIIGAYTLTRGNPLVLKKLLGVFIILFVVKTIFNFDKKLKGNNLLFGILGGIAASLFSTSGPVYATYLNDKFSKFVNFRANIIGVVGFTGIFKIPVFAANGLLTNKVFLIALLSLPVLVLAMYLGNNVNKFISEKYLRYGTLSMLSVSALLLLFN